VQEIKKRYRERVRIYTAGNKWEPRSYNLEGTVNDLGILQYENTGSSYRKCDLVLVIIFTEQPSYLPLELMVCGCLVLTSYDPATTWFLKDCINCLLTKP